MMTNLSSTERANEPVDADDFSSSAGKQSDEAFSSASNVKQGCLANQIQIDEEFDCESESSALSEQINEVDEQVSPTNVMAFEKKESRDVKRFKVVVLLLVLVLAVVASTCVLVFTNKSEQSQFEASFQQEALKVLEAIRNSIDNTLMPLDNLAVALVSHAKANNLTWPFVTLDDFGIRIAKVLPLTDAIFITVLPAVTPENRLQWENYTHTHHGWVDEALHIQGTWELYYGPKNLTFDPDVRIEIGGNDGPLESNTSRVMLPQWQLFPNIFYESSYAYNYDWLAVTAPGAPFECYSKHRSILSDPYLIPEPDDPVFFEEGLLFSETFAPYSSSDEDPYEPVMDIFYPIINDLSRVRVASSDDYDAQNNTLVGVLAATVYWRNIIKNTLSLESSRIVVVFNNTCTKSFTYQINGPDVVFVGVNDKHDKQYDFLRVSSKITDLEAISSVASLYSGAPISDDYCPYTLHLYPTDEMRSEYTTKSGAIYASVTLLVILSLGVVFALYDFKVERRQKKVLSSAIRSSEIVSSLFPSSVQDQLYPMQANGDDKRSAIASPNQSKDDVCNSDHIVGGPIAQLYPETTVMFADIKGFTQWSADRLPTQVFHLLESLYGAFDTHAKICGVFKVETIGDTYVAVVGLPIPRKQHALIMARFAKKCLMAMDEVTRKLVDTLGPDTADLSLRVGLNSGPTTAGVLRGDKARFQLFGDTVNTAARMESNGESNRIHVSPSTAELIEQSGKGHWLTLRDNTIMVKGKGEMQTFWCEPTTNTKRSSVDGESTIPSNRSHGSDRGTPEDEPFEV